MSMAAMKQDHFEAPVDLQPKKVNYMLFLKAPNCGDDKKLKSEKVDIMALSSTEE